MKGPQLIDGESYSEWKGWGTPSSFGQVARGSVDYFDRELRIVSRASATGEPFRVLEVGFGDGEFLAYGRSRGWTMTGTEISPVLIRAGREAGFDVYEPEFLATVNDGSFDLIVGFDVLEHIPPASSVDFVKELALKLKPTGHIVFRFPNADTWLGAPMQNGDPTHVNAIGYLKLTWLCGESGLQIKRFRAPVRRGFRTSVVHGLHRVFAAPVVHVIAAFAKGLYFPSLPFVLSSSNVVVILHKRSEQGSAQA